MTMSYGAGQPFEGEAFLVSQNATQKHSKELFSLTAYFKILKRIDFKSPKKQLLTTAGRDAQSFRAQSVLEAIKSNCSSLVIYLMISDFAHSSGHYQQDNKGNDILYACAPAESY